MVSSVTITKMLLAESYSDTATRIVSYLEEKKRWQIKVCNDFFVLMQMLTIETPDLLVLGTIKREDKFTVCATCHQRWEKLPIIMLSMQLVIDESLQQQAFNKGAIEILSSHPLCLTQTFEKIEKLRFGLSKGNINNTEAITLTNGNILMAMREISEFSNVYLGPLARGNYWRKSHAQLIGQYPELQFWSCDNFGVINFLATNSESELSQKHLEGLQQWIICFINECQRVILDFREMLQNAELSAETKKLLLDLKQGQ